MIPAVRLFALRGPMLSKAGGSIPASFYSVSKSRSLYAAAANNTLMSYNNYSSRVKSYSTSSSTTTEGESKTDEKKSEVSETGDKDKLIAEKDKEIASLKDGLLRSLADFQNLQKITEREKQQAKEFAIRSFASDLVSNMDVLQLALNSVAEEKRADKSSSSTATAADLVDLYTGVEMTKKELERTLNRHGVEQFNPVGEKFDPNRHEALYQAPVPGKEAGTVIECSKVGWVIKDRLLRAAQVGVVVSAD